MAAAARAAADPRILEAVDSMRVVNILSWRYRDPGRLLAERIRADRRLQPRTPASAAMCRRRWSTRHAWTSRRGAPTSCSSPAPKPSAPERDCATAATSRTGRVKTSRCRSPMAPTRICRWSVRRRTASNCDLPAYVYPLFEQALRIDAGESPDDASQAYRRIVVEIQRGGTAATRMPGSVHLCRPRRSGDRAMETGWSAGPTPS